MSKRLNAEAIINKVVSVDLIDPHPDNYNQHPDEQISQLASSHAEFGQYRSVVLWQRPGGRYVQVAGHGYLQAAKGEGTTEVRADVLPEETDPVTVKALMIADNEHAKHSVTDDEMLAHLLQEQMDAGYDLAAMGSDEESLRQMLEALGDGYMGTGGDEDEDDFEAEPDEEQTRVRLGDIWKLGRHTIACLSATDPTTYEKLTQGKDVQMVWSDPPYGISIVATNGYVGGGEAYDIPFGGVKNKKHGDVGGGAAHIRKTGKSYLQDWQEKKNGLAPKGLGTIGGAKPFGSNHVRGSDGAANLVDVGKYAPIVGDDSIETAVVSSQLCLELFPKAVQIWWGSNYYAHMLPPSSCWIVWDKENTGNFADAELAWCSDKSAVRIFKHMWNGMLKDSEHGQKRVHPSQKPIKLAEWAFEKYGNEQDVIFDPFLGSGMSLIAAENTNRTVIGCELSPEYINIILSRWENHTNQTAQLISRAEEVAHA